MNPKIVKKIDGKCLMSAAGVLSFVLASEDSPDCPSADKARARELSSKLFGLARTYGNFNQGTFCARYSLYARDGQSERVIEMAQFALRDVPTAELARVLSNVGKGSSLNDEARHEPAETRENPTGGRVDLDVRIRRVTRPR